MNNLANPSLRVCPETLTYASNSTVTSQHEFNQIRSSNHTTMAAKPFAEAQEQAEHYRELFGARRRRSGPFQARQFLRVQRIIRKLTGQTGKQIPGLALVAVPQRRHGQEQARER
jgi:hypothetical protein